jgi:hypothetical protein
VELREVLGLSGDGVDVGTTEELGPVMDDPLSTLIGEVLVTESLQ